MSRALAVDKDGKLIWEKGGGRARGVHKPGEMNNTESEYAQMLDARIAAGEIRCYWFETFTFKLANDCRYTPDFVVMLMNDVLECHEVKGGWIAEDSTIKLRMASGMLPFRFLRMQKLAKKDGGTWELKEF